MRKITATAFLVLTLAGVVSSAAPAAASRPLPVEVRQECGSYNVYVFGTPLITYVWCPDPA